MHKNPSKIFKSPSVFKEKITFPINKLMFYLIKLYKTLDIRSATI